MLKNYCIGKGFLSVDNANVKESCLNNSNTNQNIFNTWTGKIISKFICKYPTWVCTSNLDVYKQKLYAESN